MPDGKQTEIPLRKPVQLIGRQTDCQIRIPSGQVSRHHCELTISGEKIAVRDLGSSNGTYVNKRRVTQTELSPGDLIAVADLVFVLRVDGRPMAIDSDDVIEDGQVLVNSGAAAPSRPTMVAGAKPSPAKPAPAPKGNDDSDADEFDFLDEEDDIKKQPKL